MCLILTLLLSVASLAESNCTAWPSLSAHGGPRLAATGMPFTNFMRFDCTLGERFFASSLEGHYRLREEKIAPASSLTTFTLPSGEILYQAIFSVSDRAEAGIYTFDGCVRIRDRQNNSSVCLKLPVRHLEIVRAK